MIEVGQGTRSRFVGGLVYVSGRTDVTWIMGLRDGFVNEEGSRKKRMRKEDSS